MTDEELKELLATAYASAVEEQKRRYEYLTLPLKERYKIMLAERDALAVQPTSEDVP